MSSKTIFSVSAASLLISASFLIRSSYLERASEASVKEEEE
jgi:hypothetical protein